MPRFRTPSLLLTLLFPPLLMVAACAGPVGGGAPPTSAPERDARDVWASQSMTATLCYQSVPASLAVDFAAVPAGVPEGSLVAAAVLELGDLTLRGVLAATESGDRVEGALWTYDEHALLGFDLELDRDEPDRYRVEVRTPGSFECPNGLVEPIAFRGFLEPRRGWGVDFDDAYEPNFAREIAAPLPLGIEAELVLFPDDGDWFSFEVASPSLLEIDMTTSEGSGATFIVQDEYKRSVCERTIYHDSGNADLECPLPTGRYWLVSTEETEDPKGSAYRLRIDAVAPPDSSQEPNETMESATPVDLAVAPALEGYLLPDERDWYVFDVAEASRVTFRQPRGSSERIYFDLDLYDASGRSMAVYPDPESPVEEYVQHADLRPGRYAVLFDGSMVNRYGWYEVSIDVDPADASAP